MNRKHYAAVSAGALLAATATQVQADTTVQVSVSHAAEADYSVFFPEVMDATDLVSISSGATVNTGEGGTMTIEAIYEDENNVDQFFQIYSGAFGFPFFVNNPLSQYTGNNYTAFNGPLNVKGLRIESGGVSPAQSATLFLPANTILTFAVPEPTVTALIFSGLLLMALRRSSVYR